MIEAGAILFMIVIVTIMCRESHTLVSTESVCCITTELSQLSDSVLIVFTCNCKAIVSGKDGGTIEVFHVNVKFVGLLAG